MQNLPTQIFLYGLALSVGVLALTVAYLVTLYRKTVSEVYNLKKTDRVKLSDEITKRADKVITVLSGDLEKRFRQELEDTIDDSKVLLSSQIQNVTSQIGEDMLVQVKDVGKIMRESTLGIQEGVRKVVEEKYAQVEKEIEEYKAKRYAEIDAKAPEILKKVLTSVISKAAAADQERLVLDSLEDAKRQNIF